jgi:hypothetical protein
MQQFCDEMIRRKNGDSQEKVKKNIITPINWPLSFDFFTNQGIIPCIFSQNTVLFPT